MDASVLVKSETNIDEPQMRSRSNTWPSRPKQMLTSSSEESQHATVTIDETPELDFDLGENSEHILETGTPPCQDPDSSYCSDLPLDHGVKKTPTRKNAWGNLSYADLITKAIQSTSEKRLTLSQIYEWMVQNVPYFRDKGDSNSSAGWKNSIRHNLSLHNRFMRIQNEGAGKSSWWVMNPDAKPGKTPRRRATSMDTKAYEKKRGRAKKKVEAMRAAGSNGLLDGGSASGSLDPVSGGMMDGSDYPLSPGGFRSRASSNASSIGVVLSPRHHDTDMHSSQVPQMSPWGSESNLSDYLADAYVGEQDSLAANLVDIMKLTSSEMSGSYMAELTEGLAAAASAGSYGQLSGAAQVAATQQQQTSMAHIQQLQPSTNQLFGGHQQQQSYEQQQQQSYEQQQQQQQQSYEQQQQQSYEQQQQQSYELQAASLFRMSSSPAAMPNSYQDLSPQPPRHYSPSVNSGLLGDVLTTDTQQQQQHYPQPGGGLLGSLLSAESPQQQQYSPSGGRLLGGLLASDDHSPPSPQHQYGSNGNSTLLSSLLSTDTAVQPQPPLSLYRPDTPTGSHLEQRFVGQSSCSNPSMPPFSRYVCSTSSDGGGNGLSCNSSSLGSCSAQRPLPSSASSLLRAALQHHQQLSMLRPAASDHATGYSAAIAAGHSQQAVPRHKSQQRADMSFGTGGVCASLSQLAFARNHQAPACGGNDLSSRSSGRQQQHVVSSGYGAASVPELQRQQSFPNDLDFNFDSLRAEAIECDVDLVIRQELSIDGSLDFSGMDSYQPCGSGGATADGGRSGSGGLVLS